MGKSAASERCRYRAACRDRCEAVNRTMYPGYMRMQAVPYHMRRKFPGWRARVKEWNDTRLPYAERKAKSEYKGYAPLMDGTRMVEPKWRQKKLSRLAAAGEGEK